MYLIRNLLSLRGTRSRLLRLAVSLVADVAALATRHPRWTERAARHARRAGMPRVAEYFYRQVDPMTWELQWLQGAAHFWLERDSHREAAQIYEEIAGRDPSDAGRWLELAGQSRLRHGERQVALGHLELALDEPRSIRHPRLRIDVASLREESMEWHVAARLARENVKEFPDHAESYYVLARNLEKIWRFQSVAEKVAGGDLVLVEVVDQHLDGFTGLRVSDSSILMAALAAFEESTRLNPSPLGPRFAWSQLLMDIGRFEEALTVLTSLIKEDALGSDSHSGRTLTRSNRERLFFMRSCLLAKLAAQNRSVDELVELEWASIGVPMRTPGEAIGTLEPRITRAGLELDLRLLPQTVFPLELYLDQEPFKVLKLDPDQSAQRVTALTGSALRNVYAPIVVEVRDAHGRAIVPSRCAVGPAVDSGATSEACRESAEAIGVEIARRGRSGPVQTVGRDGGAARRPLVLVTSKLGKQIGFERVPVAEVRVADGRVLAENPAIYEALQDLVLAVGPDRFAYLTYQQDPELDSAVHEYAQGFAHQLVGSVADELSTIAGSVWSTTLHSGLAMAAGDEIARLLRVAVMTVDYARVHGLASVRVLGEDGEFASALVGCLPTWKHETSVTVDSVSTATPAPLLDGYVPMPPGTDVYGTTPRFDFPADLRTALRKISATDILVVGTSKNSMYNGALEAVLDKMTDFSTTYVSRDGHRIGPAGPARQRGVKAKTQGLHLPGRINALRRDEVMRLCDALTSDARIRCLDPPEFRGERLDLPFLTFSARNVARTSVHVLSLVRVFDEVFRRSSPAAVLCSPARSFEGVAAIAAARARGITSFDLQSGTVAPSRRTWRPLSDIVFASDVESQRIFREVHGVSHEAAIAVGSPWLDHRLAVAPPRPSRPSPSSEHSRCRVILTLQTLPIETTERLIDLVGDAIARCDDVDLTVSIHPGERSPNVMRVRARTRRLFPRARIVHGGSLEEFACHDVCVTYCSSSGFEAHAVGCRVIAINPTDGSWLFRLARAGVATEVTSSVELRTAILTRPPLGSQPIESELTGMLTDGGAAERIRAILLERSKLGNRKFRTRRGPLRVSSSSLLGSPGHRG